MCKSHRQAPPAGRHTQQVSGRQAGRQGGGGGGGASLPLPVHHTGGGAAAVAAAAADVSSCVPAVGHTRVRLREATVGRGQARSPQEVTDLVTRTDPVTHSQGSRTSSTT